MDFHFVMQGIIEEKNRIISELRTEAASVRKLYADTFNKGGQKPGKWWEADCAVVLQSFNTAVYKNYI